MYRYAQKNSGYGTVYANKGVFRTRSNILDGKIDLWKINAACLKWKFFSKLSKNQWITNDMNDE